MLIAHGRSTSGARCVVGWVGWSTARNEVAHVKWLIQACSAAVTKALCYVRVCVGVCVGVECLKALLFVFICLSGAVCMYIKMNECTTNIR